MDDAIRRLKIQILAAQLVVLEKEFTRLGEELRSPFTTTERRAQVNLRCPRLEAQRMNIESDLQWQIAEERLRRSKISFRSALSASRI